MSALAKVVRAGVGRRRVQTTVVVVTVLVAVTASVLAAGLLVASRAPFDHAFAAQRGAQLTAAFDGAKVTPGQLAATDHAPGVRAAAGPYPTATVPAVVVGGGSALPAGFGLGPLTVVGRSAPGGPVDDLTMVSGHWITGPGQLVLSDERAVPDIVGQRLRLSTAPGAPALTVVGVARSVSQTADAWASPAQVDALTAAGTSPGYQVLYRFAHAGSAAALTADTAAVAATLPAGAMTGSQSYLAVRQIADTNTAAFVPFVAAFGILGLVLSVLIIGIVVSGSVGAATRRIGVLKSLGFTPAQVVRAYLAQALVPAAVGAVLGVIVGNLLAVPVLQGAENGYGTAQLTIPFWLDVAVPAALLGAVALAAAVPALRAGRLRSAEAIAVGRTPRGRGGRRAQRLAGRLPVPRAVGLGLGHPAARPSRSATTAAAVVLGTIAVSFAVGLSISLGDVQNGRELDSAGAVVVDVGGPGPQAVPGGGPVLPARTASDPRAVAAAIGAQPGTRSYYGTTRAQVSVSGISGATQVIGYQGDSSWATHQMVSGYWLDGPGQAVVTARLLTAAGAHVGDRLTLASGGRTVRVQVVGEVFALSDDGMDLLTGTSTLAALHLDAQPDQYHVALEPGTGVHSYIAGLDSVLRPLGAEASPNFVDQSSVIAAMDALIGMLTVMLVVVAGLGVLNTVALDTRERVHDLGVFRALGMTPRQTVAMVLTSVGAIGLLAAVVGVPIGVAVHHYVLPRMAQVTGERVPSVDVAVYALPVLVALVVGGLLISLAGALLPAGWAAGTPAQTALRTE